jgi:hypothetical protein
MAFQHALIVGLTIQHFMIGVVAFPVLVCPCHHGMARPQVADRGMASYKEGSSE